ncbi:MAG: methyltransferase family protein [Chloroflexota bacterium]
MKSGTLLAAAVRGGFRLLSPHALVLGRVLRVWRALGAQYRSLEATRYGDWLLGNVWPAYLFAMPLGARVWALARAPRDDSLHSQAKLLQEVVTVIFLGLVVVLFAIRRQTTKGQRATGRQAGVALAGTFMLNVVAYLPIQDSTSTASLLASSAVVLVGTLFTIWSLTMLGRCFGLFPEVRGLVLRGPYRLVRHPVYLGELVSALGLVLAKPHPLVAAVFAAFVALQYWRTVYEEQALALAYPSEYPAYAVRVPRLVPGLR